MENKIIETAKKVLKEPKIKYRLLGGMSNYTYVVESENELYTVRILGDYAELFVNREEEKFHLNLFKDLNITNETIYFNVETGEKISKYVKGDILTQIDYKPHLKEISEVLKTIHNSKIKSKYDYNLFKRLNFYESINIKKHLSPSYFKLKNDLFELYESTYSKFEKVLTHGDAQRSNFIVSEDKVYIVDFEFSGNNDPFYDISGFGNNNFSDGLDLLHVYLDGNVTNEDLKRYYYYKIFANTQWYLVALFKHDKGMSESLKIPFDKVSLKYLDEALKLKGEMDEIDNRWS